MEVKTIKMETIVKEGKYAADLDQALEVAGLGRCNLKHSFALTLILTAFGVDQLGYSIILSAAACDLKMSDHTRGLIGSMPYIGFFFTSFPWGYLVDTKGRKYTLLFSSLSIGVFSALSSLMPNLTSFAICKFLSSLCYPCAGAVPYTFMDEILPAKYRDVMISIMNAMQMTGAICVPLLAWAILPADFYINFGIYFYRPWRLLNMAYAAPLIIGALLLYYCPESPEYLVSKHKYDEALEVLSNMYAKNKGKRPEEFPINKLIVSPNDYKKQSFLTSVKEHTMPLLKWTYLKWMLLIGFLLIGTSSILNGLYLWAPDAINRILIDEGHGRSACEAISNTINKTLPEAAVCHDKMNEMTLLINSVSQACCAVFILIVSVGVKYIGKKNILIVCFCYTGTACLIINMTIDEIVFGVLLLSLPVLVLTMGAINAFTVEIVPTHLRGVALTMTIMLGTTGSVAGNTVTGLMINEQCEEMFYLFAGLLILCAALSVFLPSSETAKGTELKAV